jgi:hypothetical protein
MSCTASSTMSCTKTAQSQGHDHDQKPTPECSSQTNNGKGIPQPEIKDSQDSSDENNTPVDESHTTTINDAGKRDIISRLWSWKPKPARYDPENPPKFTIWLNILFGFVSSGLPTAASSTPITFS